jgi:hypothetical protein
LSTAAERSGRPAHAGDAVIPGLEVSLWEQMLSPQNLGRALRRVRANAGAPGDEFHGADRRQVAYKQLLDRQGPALIFAAGEWAAFTAGIRGGEFDLD